MHPDWRIKAGIKMAVSTSVRLGLYRWSEDTDPFNRAQMDISHANLESVAARYTQGTVLPQPGEAFARSFFFKTDTKTLYYFDGIDVDGTWRPINNLGDGIQDVGYGLPSSDGISGFAARVDHVHGLEDLGLDDYILKSTVSAKGDLIGGTADSEVLRVPVGTNGQVLTVDSSMATGMKWATAITTDTTSNLTGFITANGATVNATMTIDGGTA